MTRQIFYIYGFSLLLLSNIYAVYWNETEFLNVDKRDTRRIRNKFVTFDTTDTDVEVAFQFNVPFVAVPGERSIGSIKNSVASLVNLNLGSVAIAGVMIAFGTVGSFLWSLLFPKRKFNSNKNEDTNTTNTTGTSDSTDDTTNTDGDSADNEERRRSARANENSKFLDFIDLIDTTMNPTECVQQYICSLRKLSAKNVAEGRAASSEKIIAGIFETRWILDIISGTAIHDAIQFGESRSDCEKRFSKCGFESMRPEDLFTIFLKMSRVFGSWK